jgi:CubicO group peptidase (beta-lactamase class C family)
MNNPVRLGETNVSKTTLTLLTVFASLICLSGIATVTVAKEAPSKGVKAVLERYVAKKEIPGGMALFHEAPRPAEIAVVGDASIESKTTMAEDTLFGVMSMTKPISATALMILVDEGKVSIDDPVSKYIPAFADAKTKDGEAVRDLKIRHLLTHTSGLGGDQGCYKSLEATANALAARPFDFQPGERWQYGPSLNVVGRIVEVVSGRPFDEFLRARIFEPLAMSETTFHPTDEQRKRMAALYKKSADGNSLESSERWWGPGAPGSVPNPSGGLFTTAGDLDRFYRMILNGGELDGHRVVSAEAVRQMTSVQTGDLETGFTPGNAWGLGWCIVREPQDVTAALSPGSFGHGGAYGTQGWVDPVKKRVFVLMIQRADLGNSDGSDLRKEFQNAAVGQD